MMKGMAVLFIGDDGDLAAEDEVDPAGDDVDVAEVVDNFGS